MPPTPKTPTTLLTGSEEAIYRSTDGGDSWSFLGFASGNPIGFSAVALTRDDQMIAGATSEAVSGKRGTTTFVKKIHLYRASDGAFLRSIATDTLRGIDCQKSPA